MSRSHFQIIRPKARNTYRDGQESFPPEGPGGTLMEINRYRLF
jgi:hypothetical protein